MDIGYIIEWIYHSQGLMQFSGWGVMQYVRHWTLNLQFVIGFCKVNSRPRSIENIASLNFKLCKI